MNQLLEHFLRILIVLFDGILTYSFDLHSHLHPVDQVFSSLINEKIYLKLSKCVCLILY